MSVAVQPPDIPRKYQYTSQAGGTTVTIPSRTGHRRWLHDYFVKDGASGFTDLKVGNATLLRVYDNLAQAVLIAGLSHRRDSRGFLGTLEALIKEFPVFNAGQDEAIVLTRDSNADFSIAHWEDQDQGEITKRDLPGGSQGKKHLFILNLNNGAAIAATGTTNINNQDMPTGLSMFTDGSRMSANNRFTLYCVAGNFPKNMASESTRVHIFDEQIELFTSETNAGLLVDPDSESQLSFNIGPGAQMFWLDEPYVFQPNRNLAFKLDATYDGANALAINTQKLFLIGIREML